MKAKIISATVFSIAAILILSAAAGRTSERTERDATLASLIEAERAFSRSSEDKGIREAFLAWLAPDAVVFRPGPVPGRPVYEKMDPANQAVLTWGPEVADVAASGELGYSSGPYQVRPERGAEPASYGHYISVWKKQPDGAWRVILDIGVQHGPQDLPRDVTDLGPATGPEAAALSPEALQAEEYRFGLDAVAVDGQAALKGTRKALSAVASDDIRVYRPGKIPSIGKRALAALIPADEGKSTKGPGQAQISSARTGVAWSGDLAYSYGTASVMKKGGTTGTTAYLRIWRKPSAGTWKIVLDVELPVPPGASADAKPGA